MKNKKVVWCHHTCPRRFLALHYKPEDEETIEFFGRKVANPIVNFVLGAILDTISLIASGLNSIFKVFHKGFIEEVVIDNRCDLCKKPN